MNSDDTEDTTSRVPLVAWIPVAILVGLLIMLLIGYLVLA